MPDQPGIETAVTYFGQYPPRNIDPKDMANSIQLSLNRLDLQGRTVSAATAFSGLFQLAHISNDQLKYLTEAQRYTRAFILSTSTLLDDLANALIVSETQNIDDETKIFMAMMNQKLAQDFWLVGHERKNSPLVQHATFFVQTIEELTKNDQIGHLLTKDISGARSQAAVMNILEMHKYLVLVPDTNDSDEIARWDVQGGVDLVAINPKGNTMYLIDVKGRKNYQTNKSRHVSTVEHLDNKDTHQVIADEVVGYCHQRSITVIDNIEYQHALIVVPTDPSYIGPFGQVDNNLSNEVIEKLVQL